MADVSKLIVNNTEYNIKDASARSSISNLGSLASKNSASGSYKPAGSVSISKGNDSTTTMYSITGVGSASSFSVSSETLTLTAGSAPTRGSATSVVTASGSVTGSFSGTQATITVT